MIKQIIAFIFIVILSFFLGKQMTKTEYEKILHEQKQKVVQLENREKEIERVIVTEYVDRIKYINNTKTKTVEVIKEVLKDESNNCIIGSGFISLFNSSASGEALSDTTN